MDPTGATPNIPFNGNSVELYSGPMDGSYIPLLPEYEEAGHCEVIRPLTPLEQLQHPTASMANHLYTRVSHFRFKYRSSTYH